MTANVGVPARAGSAIGLLGEAIRVLERWGDVHAWAGTDPYDGLNAKRFAAPFKRTTRGRQVLTQIVKRCPVDLRPLLGIPPEASAATLALAASAYTRARSLPREDALGKLDRLLAELDRKRCRNFAEPCWGYHFDVQTRVFFYPRGAPNTIATAFGGGAVLDAFERTGDETALRTAEGVGAFFLDRVPQTETETGAFFGYLVGDRTPIHNASLLAAAFLARLSAHTGSQSQRSAATDAVRYAVGLQRPDGSWPYGELPHLQWIDGYHTGYVLEALLVCKQAGIEVPLATLTRGLAYYRQNLFLSDGCPRFLAGATFPVDSICAAQGIQTFARATAVDPTALDFAWKVFEYAMRRLRRIDGAFVYQRRRFWTNKSAHPRWVEAPMLLALTHLHESEAAR